MRRGELGERLKLLPLTLILGKTKLRVSWDIRFLWSGFAVFVHFTHHGTVNIQTTMKSLQYIS
jgi:hypothetical protein